MTRARAQSAPRLPSQCPGCSAQLEVTSLCCTRCRAQVEGHFALPELLLLDREDQQFVLEFVRCSGSLKDMGKLLGLSYPTVRNRLNDIIERLTTTSSDPERQRRAVLDALSRGEIGVEEAARRLKEF